jgi:lysozyme
MIPGIDVSSYQGRIDWAQVAKSGVQFAFIKASEGAHLRDMYFKMNWTEARRNGIIVGAYHYLSTIEPAMYQANVFKSQLLNVDTSGSLPNVLDIEQQGITASLIDQWIELGQFQNPIVYLDRFMATTLGILKGSDNTPLKLWLAEYEPAVTPVPDWPWTFWQSGWARKPGIQTACDIDWFDGSIKDLRALCTG